MLGEKTFSSDIYIKKHEMKNGLPVYLNIYHLSRINYMLQVFGVGLFHTTLEVGNIEFSYGRTDDENSGIYYYSLDEDIPNLILKERLYLGNTIYNQEVIRKILILQTPYWTGRSYDPFLKNCNHFTNYFANKLLLAKVDYPVYINRVSEYGVFFSCFYRPLRCIFGNIIYNPTNGVKIAPENKWEIHTKPENNKQTTEELNDVIQRIDLIEKILEQEIQITLSYMESNHNELYLVSEEGINLKENLKFNEIVELQIDNDDDDSSLLRSIDDCNIFLKNFNDRHTGLMRILTESMHNLQQDPEVYTCITSLVKYIQLGDNLLHRDRNYAKATYTFMYVLEILEELYGYVRNYLSKSKRDIPNKSENSCYDFKINISPSQVIRDNKECFIIIKRKIFHSMRLIYNKTNNEKKEMILIEKLLNVNNFDFWAICYNCISMYNRMNNNDQIEQFITKVINVSKDTDLVNSLRSFYINLRNKKL